MSASILASDNGPSKDNPSDFAPKKARPSEPDPAPADPRPASDAAPQHGPSEPAAPVRPAESRPAPEPAEPPWKRSRQRGSTPAAFAGDVAIAELRTRLALAPDRLPEPPPPSSGGSKLAWAGRITAVAVVAAVGVIGYRWGSSPGARFQLPQRPAHARAAVAPDHSVAATADAVPVMNAVPAVYPPPAKPAPPASAERTFPQLTVAPVSAQLADDAARLAISAANAGPNTAVVIDGLAPGSALSAGRKVAPKTWRLSIDQLRGVAVTPPRGFAGTMDLTIELRLADGSVADRRSLELEWLSRSITANPPTRQQDAAEITQMMKKGAELMANGDVAAARLMYQRAAEAGDATAAFALAETYDPLVPVKGGFAPDVGLAQAWYAKARDLGSSQAEERLQRLAGRDQ